MKRGMCNGSNRFDTFFVIVSHNPLAHGPRIAGFPPVEISRGLGARIGCTN